MMALLTMTLLIMTLLIMTLLIMTVLIMTLLTMTILKTLNTGVIWGKLALHITDFTYVYFTYNSK
jgi:hypothetical protein